MKDQRDKIRETRLLRDQEEFIDQTLVKKMIAIWKDIKEIRYESINQSRTRIQFSE